MLGYGYVPEYAACNLNVGQSMTETELIHEGWNLWDIQTEMPSVWRIVTQSLDERFNKPATMLYCKPHQRDAAMKLLEAQAGQSVTV